jgi:quercetin dioxygenase-like cupin family protein
MKPMKSAGPGGVLLLLASVAAAAVAQVPVDKEPHHRVVFENAQLRILDVNLEPRTLTSEHRHDRDIATVSISPADTRTISPGQPWGPVRPRRPAGNVGTTEYTGKPGIHTIENVGDTLYRLIAVENLRDGNWSAGAPLNAPATTLAVESRAFRVYDVRLNDSAVLARHVHPVPVVAVLAAGRVVADSDAAPQRLEQPGRWIVIPQGEFHRLSADGPSAAHVVEIEIR